MLSDNLYICLQIHNNTGGAMYLSNAQLSWGKFYKNGDKDTEYSPSEYEGATIEPNGYYEVCACGRQASPSGTEGTIEVKDESKEKICTLYWNCPWMSGSNEFAVRDSNDSYRIKQSPYESSGAIGTVAVQIY